MQEGQAPTSLEYERVCPECKGERWFRHKDAHGKEHPVDCHVCSGDGSVLTDDGEALLGFLRKHIRTNTTL